MAAGTKRLRVAPHAIDSGDDSEADLLLGKAKKMEGDTHVKRRVHEVVDEESSSDDDEDDEDDDEDSDSEEDFDDSSSSDEDWDDETPKKKRKGPSAKAAPSTKKQVAVPEFKPATAFAAPPLPTDFAEKHFSRTDAMKIFCLTAKDIQLVPCRQIGGGIGVGGAMNFYLGQRLLVAAQAKHRGKFMQVREKKLRAAFDKQQKACAAADSLLKKAGQFVVPKDTIKNLKQVVGRLRTGITKGMKLDHSHPNQPGPFRAEALCNPEVFALLAGAPHDTELKSFVKKGAYITVEASLEDVLEEYADGKPLKKVANWYLDCTITADDDITFKYKPSGNLLSVHGGSTLM